MATALLLTTAQASHAAQCLSDAAGGSLNCTANDIDISFIEITGTTHDCQFIGDTFTFNGNLHVTSNATQRYDIGFYLGPDALNGDQCSVNVIPPNVAPGTQDGDVCGDVSSGGDVVVPVSNITATCEDTNGDGFFDVSTCTTWRQQANSTDCPTPTAALPGTKSKCNCTQTETTEPVPLCISNADCDDNDVCTSDVCNPSTGCVNSFLPSTTECRASTGVCDSAEFCTGSSGGCPADTDLPSTTQCRSTTGVCDVAENCTGTSADCPPDADLPSTTECRSSNGVCDQPENCTGSTATCPADADKPSTTVCRAAAGVCDIAEHCTGSTADCPSDSFATTQCRASAGVCDVAEFCDGINADCPTNDFEPTTFTCRAGTGVCDGAEQCTGSSATCPEDSFLTTPCRASAGVCDQPEFCTGSAGVCPEDTFLPSTTECRGTAGVCDVAESCTGSSANCPTDQFVSSTVECRAQNGVCDIAENCTGNSANCPNDAFEPATTVCRAANGECDVAENCTGGSGSCPGDSQQPDQTPCTPDTNVCTDDVCVGGTCTHPDNNVPCEDGLFCTVNDICTNGTCTGQPRVCNDNVDCNVDTCDDNLDMCVFSECEEQPPGGICRSPGFWATHSGTEGKGNKTTGINVTQELLDVVGPIDVCGQTISSTNADDLSNVLEALCVRVEGVQERQLYRQLVAASLNCAVSGSLGDCDTLIPGYDECNAICQGLPDGTSTVGSCITLLDCFNNGGTLTNGVCTTGTCASQPTIRCSSDLPCPLFNGQTQSCVADPNSCHAQDLCNEDIGFCPATGPASSNKACHDAQFDQCTIDSCF